MLWEPPGTVPFYSPTMGVFPDSRAPDNVAVKGRMRQQGSKKGHFLITAY